MPRGGRSGREALRDERLEVLKEHLRLLFPNASQAVPRQRQLPALGSLARGLGAKGW